MNRLIGEAKAMGNVFFGILGGEPFMHPRAARDPRPRIPTAISRSSPTASSSPTSVARKLRELGNVTPLISVEGNEIVSDERRGRAGVLSKTMAGLAELPEAQGDDRRLHEPVPDEHRRPADRKMARSADRDGRDVHLVSHLSAGRARRQARAVP